MSNLPLLEIQNLSLSFLNEGEYHSVTEGVSLQIKRGEVLGLVGESGSGKSVTAMSILKLLPDNSVRYDSGNILFYKNDGNSIDLLSLNTKEISPYRGKSIAMIFQEPMTSLNPVFTCGNQITESLRLHLKLNNKQAKLRALELFSEVLLPEPEKTFSKYPYELSGGQRQRIMIAMALAGNPSLLIADEPTTALDVTVQKSIVQLLKNLQTKYSMSILFISHDLELVSEIAERVAVMYQGKIVEENTTHNIFSNPQQAYTKGLIACRPSRNLNALRLPTIADFISPENKVESSQIKTIKTSNEIVLSIKNITTRFPIAYSIFGNISSYFTAVDNVSIDVYKGETLGIVGESGCGKTTLGRTIMQLVKQSSGNITYKGNKISKLNKTELKEFRKNLQIVFQDPYSSLNPRITIGSAIIEPMKVHALEGNNKQYREKALYFLEKTGISETYFNRYPHELSGGQRQRVCIARALALEPELLICDESVAALDVSVQAQVLNLLNDLKNEFNLTYLFITHDLNVVRFMAERILVMNKGKIEEINTAEKIFLEPKSDYTKHLIQALPGQST